MADVQATFAFSSKASECLNPVSDPALPDPCKIQITDEQDKTTFILDRQGENFAVSTTDAARVNKSYPGFKAPVKQLKEFIFLNKEFVGVFGTPDAPADIMNKVKVFGSEEIAKILLTTTNFIANGEINPTQAGKKTQLEGAIQNFVSVFGDPVAGALVEKQLKSLQTNSQLSAEAKGRIEFLLAVNEVRNQYWQALKPEMEKSSDLEKKLKKSSRDVLIFLFANHILAESGFQRSLNGTVVQEAAQTHFEVLSKVDPDGYRPEDNYFVSILKATPQLRKANIPQTYQKEYLKRLGVLDSEYEKLAVQETLRLLPNFSEQQAFRSYFRVKYGDTPARREGVDILLKNLKVQAKKDGAPSFELPMAAVSEDYKKWVQGKPNGKQVEANSALLYLLTELFERSQNMEIYWGKKVQSVPNFYSNSNIPLMGTNKTYLEGLIKWSRNFAEDKGADFPPGQKPHVGLQKWWLLGEGLVAASAFGTFGGLWALENTQEVYYARMGTLIGGSAALGAGIGNLVAYAADVDEHAWAFHLTGAAVFGTAAGLIYHFAAPQPNPFIPPGPDNPCTPGDNGNCNKFPVDPYGQSLRPGKGFNLTLQGSFDISRGFNVNFAGR
jgi:hypothetical protein